MSPDRLVEVVSRGSANSFALNALGGIGGLDRLAGLAGTLLQKDVRLIVELAERAAARAEFTKIERLRPPNLPLLQARFTVELRAP